MKSILILILAINTGAVTTAQGVFSNQTNGVLEKVIQDYPNHFKNLRGELLSSHQQESEYKSIVGIPGAISCTVTQNNAVANKPVISWQATLFSDKDFDAASKKFKELYGQIKNTIIKIEGERPVILNGKYETPDEQKKVTSVLFELLPYNNATQKLRVELTLHETSNNWRIVLSVFDKDKKEEEAIVSNTNQ